MTRSRVTEGGWRPYTIDSQIAMCCEVEVVGDTE